VTDSLFYDYIKRTENSGKLTRNQKTLLKRFLLQEKKCTQLMERKKIDIHDSTSISFQDILYYSYLFTTDHIKKNSIAFQSY
jgi:hypothetical protein